MEQLIDMERWPRRAAYEFFSGRDNPFWAVTFEMDVTGLRRYTRERGLSFYLALTYLSAEAMDSVENFRYATRDGRVVLLDRRRVSFTDLHPGASQFHIVTMPREGTLDEFCRAAKEKSESQDFFIDPAGEGCDLIYISCLPGVKLTALTNEMIYDEDDNIPRITWGRYEEKDGRVLLHIALEVNHRFVDGYHVSQFVRFLERRIAGLEEASACPC